MTGATIGNEMTRLAVLMLWRLLALASVALALAGVFLPVLPTTPFLLVAAWSGGKGWPQLERWLLQHPRHGPAIRRWRDHRAVPRRAKGVALATMAASIAMVLASPAPLAVKVGVPLLLSVVATWLWRRPEN
jgi:uncharacterized membrane protein YbaN (DUF454 family)